MMADMSLLFRKYEHELRSHMDCWHRCYHAMQRQGHGTTFGDVEGEILYMLARERRPDVVVEISPDAGWSTNYLLAALTANAHGTLHTFELDRRVGGMPIERVIRGNLAHEWDQSRLVVHLGDARRTTAEVEGRIDLLFLDSAHDAEFARWYIGSLFPRVNGPVMIHDVAFVDHLEPSGEASVIWEWSRATKRQLGLAGEVEASLTGTWRRGFVERRPYRSNAIFFELPDCETGELPRLRESPRTDIGSACQMLVDGGSAREAKRLLDGAIGRPCGPIDPFLHWDYFQAAIAYARLGYSDDSDKCLRRAMAFAIEADPLFRRKVFRNLIEWSLEYRSWLTVGRLSLLALGCGEVRGSIHAGRWTINRLRNSLVARWRRVRSRALSMVTLVLT